MYSTNYADIAMNMVGCSSFVQIYLKTVISTVDRILVIIQMDYKRMRTENQLIFLHWSTSKERVVWVIRMIIIKEILDFEEHQLQDLQGKVIIVWIKVI